MQFFGIMLTFKHRLLRCHMFRRNNLLVEKTGILRNRSVGTTLAYIYITSVNFKFYGK